jgi:hypothetical protein
MARTPLDRHGRTLREHAGLLQNDGWGVTPLPLIPESDTDSRHDHAVAASMLKKCRITAIPAR